MTTPAFALAYVGMLALCLAMPRHYRQLFASAPMAGRQRWLRMLALGLLLGSAILDSIALGLSIGLVVWLAQLMFAGVLVGLLLAWRSRWLFPLGGLLCLTGLVPAIVGP